jgi:hypothetical protein
VIIIDDNITIKEISGNISEFGTPIVKGREAKTAAAKPLGNIIVIRVLTDFRLDLIVAILIIINLIPRKANVSKIPNNADEKVDNVNKSPVKTKKKDRIKKLI